MKIKLNMLWANDDEVVHIIAKTSDEVQVRSLRTGDARIESIAKIKECYKPADHLLKVPYRRWKHREHGHEVEVLNFLRYSNHYMVGIFVEIDRTAFKKQPTTLTLATFLGLYTPVLSSKIRKRSVWQRLRSV